VRDAGYGTLGYGGYEVDRSVRRPAGEVRPSGEMPALAVMGAASPESETGWAGGLEVGVDVSSVRRAFGWHEAVETLVSVLGGAV
jgi:hypothetical protein